ncbi:MAG: hypothetical protein J7507_09110, partial [Pseudoxanthomonas sp.]|nr:hypothetical protein [Pseudoxanthomonas sp.]
MNPQHDPLDPQERALARLLDPTPVPPAELDARILAAARAASRPTQPKAPRRHRRWPVALGLAASVTLAIGVAWQLREPPRPAAELAIVADAVLPAATADMPPPPPPAPDAPTAAERPAPVDPLTAEAHRAAVAAGTERSRQRSEKAGRQVELQAEAEAASRSEAVRAQETAVATAQVRATQRAEKAARQADLQAAAVEVEQARAQEVAAAAALARMF